MMRFAMLLSLLGAVGVAGGAEPPRIAFFPLGGDATAELRDKCGFSLRAKLDRTGVYEVIDGPKMLEIAAEAEGPITFDTPAEAVRELGKLLEADVLVWGQISGANELRLNVLDLRGKDARPRELRKTIKEPTDLRFVSEEVLQTLKGVGAFEHPSEEAVSNDPAAELLWKKNPNLVVNGDFARAGAWQAIYQAEKYPVPVSAHPPEADTVVIQRLGEEGKLNNVLAMNLSRACAEGAGMACLSEPIRIEPDTRYRLSFRYRSDGPTLHVFVKGYTLFENIEGRKVEREIYRRQVPPSGKTDGKWVTVVDELNPQHVAFPVQALRVDLYAYLNPGVVMFDDVVLKAVGKPTRHAKDEAIRKPIER